MSDETPREKQIRYIRQWFAQRYFKRITHKTASDLLDALAVIAFVEAGEPDPSKQTQHKAE